MTDVAELGVAIKLTGAQQAADQLDHVSKSAVKVEKETVAASRGASLLGGVLGGLAKGLASTFSIAAFVKVIDSAIDSMEALGESAQKIGIPAKDLAVLQYAAKASNVEVDALEKAMKSLNVEINKISSGQATDAKAALDSLGISIKDSNGKTKTQYKLLSEIAEKFSQYEDGATKTAAAVAIFNRNGQDLIPMLNEGKEGLAQSAYEAKKFGRILTDESIASAKEFNDNLDRLKAIGGGLAMEFANNLLPVLIELTDSLVSLKTTSSNMFDGLGESIRTEINDLKTIGNLFKMLASDAVVLKDEIAGIFSDPTNISSYIDKANEAFSRNLASVKEQARRMDILAKSDQTSNKEGKSDFGMIGVAPKKILAPFKTDHEKKKRRDAYAEVVKDLELERKNIGMSNLTQEINNKLRAANVKATSEQGKNIAALVTANYKLEFAEKTSTQSLEWKNKKLEEQKEIAKGFLDDVMSNIKEGESIWKSFGDAALSALGKISDKLFDMASTGLVDSIFNSGGNALYGGSSGGFFGRLLGGIKNLLPSFDVGTNYVPRDMVANIHKGEMIVPSYDASSFRNGNGTNISFHVENKSTANVAEPVVEKLPDGSTKIKMIIQEEMRKQVSSGGMDKAMQSRFAIRPASVVR